jgi:hypothetical protein
MPLHIHHPLYIFPHGPPSSKLVVILRGGMCQATIQKSAEYIRPRSLDFISLLMSEFALLIKLKYCLLCFLILPSVSSISNLLIGLSTSDSQSLVTSGISSGIRFSNQSSVLLNSPSWLEISSPQRTSLSNFLFLFFLPSDTILSSSVRFVSSLQPTSPALVSISSSILSYTSSLTSTSESSCSLFPSFLLHHIPSF